ncbi:hypothetical protein DV736_g2166, partial [Chaetothyriales sp. CBS 134916]
MAFRILTHDLCPYNPSLVELDWQVPITSTKFARKNPKVRSRKIRHARINKEDERCPRPTSRKQAPRSRQSSVAQQAFPIASLQEYTFIRKDSDYEPLVAEIWNDQIHRGWPKAIPYTTPQGINVAVRQCIKFISTDDSAYYILLCGGIIGYTSWRHDRVSIKTLPRLFHKTRINAVRALRKDVVSLGHGMPSDALLATILSFALQETVYHNHTVESPPWPKSPLARAQLLNWAGDLNQHSHHLDAFFSLLERRGGFGTVTDPGLRRLIYICDLLTSSVNATAPRFPQPDSRQPPVSISQLEFDADALQLSSTFGAMFKQFSPLSWQFIEPLIDLLPDIRQVTVAIDMHHRSLGKAPPLGKLADLANSVHWRILSLRERSEHSSSNAQTTTPAETTDPHEMGMRFIARQTLEPVRLAILIFSNLAIFPVSISAGVAAHLASSLRDLYERNQVRIFEPEFEIWILAMGCIASWGTNDRLWFLARLKHMTDRLSRSRGEELSLDAWLHIMRGFLWWEHPARGNPPPGTWFKQIAATRTAAFRRTSSSAILTVFPPQAWELPLNISANLIDAIPPPLPPPLPRPQALFQPKLEECYGVVTTKQKPSGMAKKGDTETSSLTRPTQAPEVNGAYCLCQPEPKIPRPRNAFILYRQHQQATVVRQYPGLPNPEISKIIGEHWSNLAEDQKQRWKALAEEEKARHALQYPDYRYQPRRNGRYSAASAGHASGQSTGTSSKVDSNGNCIKCGGKTMNPPATPHPLYSPPAQDRDRLRSPPYGRALYGPRDPHSMSYQSPHPRHDHRYHPPYRQSISAPHQPTSAVESYGHDLKRRRFDGAGIYIPTRESPPEKTANDDGPAKPSQSQESGLAAMIMSIPVLNKIKILSTVSPSLVAPHPTSPPLSTRGAVVAIDGPDLHSVWDMTNSLKIQLEREGSFVAKIFTGPDPAKFFAISNGPSTGPKGPVSTADVLRLAEEWHKVSDEMRRYITTRPGPAKESVAARRTSILDVDMLEAPENATWSASLERKSSDVAMAETSSAAKIPDHPPFDHGPLFTTLQTVEVDDGGKSKSHSHPTAVCVNSLSKPSELAITAATSPRVTRSRSTASPSAMSTSTTTSSMHPSCSTPASAIPIALVPHYQLSTTNYCAIHTTISDAYSPGSHWQWVAALWRGTIGPDVTVAVRPVGIRGSSDEEISSGFGVVDGPLSNGDERMTAAAAKEKPASYGPGVEVRLLDYRAVIVRTMGKGGQPQKNGPGLKLSEEDDKKAEEFWEKVKRRVGFEVAEFLRR